MSLTDGYHDLPPGKLANVVTCLEMRARAARAQPASPAGRIERWTQPEIDRYRALIRRIGEAHLWQAPLLIPDQQLTELIRDKNVELHTLVVEGEDHGIVQLDFRRPADCELALFGVSERVRGTGAARAMMNHALARAWSRPITRLWLHTCTLDHPDALPFYIRTGFVPYKRQIEIHDDPRFLGLYPKTAAPGVPLL